MIEVLVVPEYSSCLSLPERQNNDLTGQRNLKCSPLALMIEVLVVLKHSSELYEPKRHNNDFKEQNTLEILTLGFDD